MEIRTLRSKERDALLDLLDGWDLPDGWQGRDFFRRFLEFDPTFEDENVMVADDNGELISCVQIFPRRLRLLGLPVPTGGIGSVFTRADRRGAGIAGALLERAVEMMCSRRMELSMLFADRVSFYEKFGWRSLKCQRTVLRPPDPGTTPVESGDFEILPFDWERDFEAVKAIHSAYSGLRNGTVVRDDALWGASFRLAGNPVEEFRVARRDGSVLAYVRATLLNEAFMVTELARLDDGAGALAALLIDLLKPREDDPIAPPGRPSREIRAFAVLPAFDDILLTVDLENHGVSSHPVDDPSTMIRCLNAPALAERLDVSLLPGENGEEFLTRILPPDSLVFWPADRF